MIPAAARSSASFNYFLAHTGLYQFSSNLAGVFFVAFMLKQGVPQPLVFLSMAGVFALRFCLRPLVVELAKVAGLRGALVVGTVVSCLQYLTLARLQGVDVWLLAWVVATAVGDGIYWTLFHVVFAAVGDGDKLGRQTSVRQLMFAAASVGGPPIGGLMLTAFSPWVAFTVAGLMRAASSLPLLGIAEPPFEREAPSGAYRAGAFGAAVFMTDGWNICGAGVAWAMISFYGLGERFDSLGLALSAASAVGAAGGFVIGRLVDLGHATRAVLVNLLAAVSVLVAQSAAASHPTLVVGAMVFAALAGGLSIPTMMPAVYGAIKGAPCALRFQFATEGGWDTGAVAASLCAAGLAWLGWPLWSIVLSAIPALMVQAGLLVSKYKSRTDAVALAN